jgi:tripartite-type tricarboxylate transporter receptor subunit TctC
MNVKTLGALTFLALACGPLTARAADYPTNVIKIIVPFAPGGTNDIVARALAQVMSKSLPANVIIENRPGGATLIGSRDVANSAPDGYTLLYTSGLAMNELLYRAKSNKTQDFAPIAVTASLPLAVFVNKAVPDKPAELAAYSKANTVHYGIFGIGGLAHLACASFASSMGINMEPVMYRGGQPALMAALAGELQVVCDTLAVDQHVGSGALKPVGLMSKERSPYAPEIPTFAELGYPGLEASIVHGLYAPAGTPKEIIEKLNVAVNDALKDPSVQKIINTFAGQSVGGSPQGLADQQEADRARWGKVINDLSIDLSRDGG